MLERRSGKTRWYPETYDDFLYYCDGGYDNSKEYDELDDPIWEYDNDEASVPKTAAIPDLNEMKPSAVYFEGKRLKLSVSCNI